MLKLRHLFLAGVALLALTPIVAKAGGAPSQTYAEVGNWTVFYYPDSNHCTLATTFNRGTTVFMARRQGVWTFAFGNPAWNDRLQAGKRYQITIVLDGHDKWTDSFEARDIGDGDIGLYFNNVSIDFLWSVMKRNRIELIVHKTGETLTSLPLSNSYAAMMKVAECNNRADANGGGRQAPTQPAPQQRRIPEFSA